LAPEEQSEARALAEQIGVRLVEVRSKEIEDPRYAQNPVNRCYFCKTELYDLCSAQKASLGVSTILDGFNADDFKDHRPGHQAAREHQVVSPLAAAGLGKEEIRAWSQRLGLPTWDKPQMACLASRIPYGTSVTPERLSQLAPSGRQSSLPRCPSARDARAHASCLPVAENGRAVRATSLRRPLNHLRSCALRARPNRLDKPITAAVDRPAR